MSLFNKFLELSEKKVIYNSEVIIKYDTLSKNNKVCLVEGKNDILFYKKILKNNLSFIECRGKDQVLKCFDTIVKLFSFSHAKNNYYIIDLDYNNFVLLNTQYKRNKITLTKYYSIENYFFTKENLTVLFYDLFHQNDELIVFEAILAQFFHDFLEYEAMKMTFVLAKKAITGDFNKLYHIAYIENNTLMYKINLQEFLNHLKKYIEEYSLDLEYEKNLKYMKKSVLYFKGKLLMELLDIFLKKKTGKSIDLKDLFMYIEKMHMDFVLK